MAFHYRKEADPVSIPGKFLRNSAPGPTTLPPGFVVTKLPCRAANGARKAKTGCVGGAATTGYAVQRGKHASVRNYAARGFK